MSKFAIGVIERAAASYVFSPLTFALADAASYTSLSGAKTAALAAVPAGLSVLKSALSKFVGDPESGSLTA